jgi:hypothetical protein
MRSMYDALPRSNGTIEEALLFIVPGIKAYLQLMPTSGASDGPRSSRSRLDCLSLLTALDSNLSQFELRNSLINNGNVRHR